MINYENLLKCSLFKGMDPSLIESSFKDINYHIDLYKKGESIAFRGDLVDGAYILIDGVLFSEMVKNDGNSKIIEEINVGTLIAGAFIFGKKPFFPVDLISKVDSHILRIEKDSLLKMVARDKTLLLNLLTSISSKAQFLSESIWKTFSSKTISSKVANYILENKDGDTFKMPMSQSNLASYFNVTRPSLSRVISSLVDDGTLEKKGRSVYNILDIDKLLKAGGQ